MDIIYQLPFPDEICSKIVLYAFKSTHTDLQDEIFKRAVPTDIYQKLVEKGEIEIDAQGHITKAKCLWNSDDLESIQFDIRVLPKNLTSFSLSWTGVFGNIQNLPTNLTKFYLNDTDVTGDIQVLQGIQQLTEFSLSHTGVFGNIEVLQGLPNLTRFDLYNTGVTGDKEAFRNYRKSHGLNECYMYL